MNASRIPWARDLKCLMQKNNKNRPYEQCKHYICAVMFYLMDSRTVSDVILVYKSHYVWHVQAKTWDTTHCYFRQVYNKVTEVVFFNPTQFNGTQTTSRRVKHARPDMRQAFRFQAISANVFFPWSCKLVASGFTASSICGIQVAVISSLLLFHGSSSLHHCLQPAFAT